MREPKVYYEGVLELGTPDGVATPPGSELVLKDKGSLGRHVLSASLYQLLRAFEGCRIGMQIYLLEEPAPEPRQLRTIRDLTGPR